MNIVELFKYSFLGLNYKDFEYSMLRSNETFHFFRGTDNNSRSYFVFFFF